MKTKTRGEFVCGTSMINAQSRQITATVSTSTLVHFTPEEPTEKQSLKLIEESGVLDFWNSAEEDVYSHDDGTPV